MPLLQGLGSLWLHWLGIDHGADEEFGRRLGFGRRLTRLACNQDLAVGAESGRVICSGLDRIVRPDQLVFLHADLGEAVRRESSPAMVLGYRASIQVDSPLDVGGPTGILVLQDDGGLHHGGGRAFVGAWQPPWAFSFRRDAPIQRGLVESCCHCGLHGRQQASPVSS
jgi:hypothetical protein